jgi:copper transport protein
LLLVLTPTAAGHADIAGPLGFAADAAHVAAAATWVGGLAFVATALLWTAGGDRWELAARSVPRLSMLAVAAVALLIVAGVTSAYLEVRAWRGLWQSTYGVLILVKVGLVVPVLALGAFNNRVSVPRLRANLPSPRARRRFLEAAGLELALLVVVVGVTSVLIGEAPAKDTVARTSSRSVRTVIGPFTGSVKVSPARAGSNRIELMFSTASGRPARLAEVKVAASLPSRKLGPLRFTAQRSSPGRYVVAAAPFAIAGDWRLQLSVRRGKFDEWLKTIDMPVQKGL